MGTAREIRRRISGRRPHARVEWFLVACLAVPLWLAHLWRVLSSVDGEGALRVLGGALFGILTVDGLSGVVHWACDTWGDEERPGFGHALVRSFREHHRDPRAMLSHAWTEVNRETIAAAAATLIVVSLPPVREVLVRHPLSAGFLAAFVAYGSIANQLHYWAHADDTPVVVRWLQRLALVLPPGHHRRHHRVPRTSAYCVATGWLNPVLDGLGFWRSLEGAISRLTGARARPGAAEEPEPAERLPPRSRNRTVGGGSTHEAG